MTIALHETETGCGSAPIPRLTVIRLSVAAFARNLLHRRAALRVAELPDHLLSDMGLKRDDVHYALNASWREDPTLRLAHSAGCRRRQP